MFLAVFKVDYCCLVTTILKIFWNPKKAFSFHQNLRCKELYVITSLSEKLLEFGFYLCADSWCRDIKNNVLSTDSDRTIDGSPEKCLFYFFWQPGKQIPINSWVLYSRCIWRYSKTCFRNKVIIINQKKTVHRKMKNSNDET